MRAWIAMPRRPVRRSEGALKRAWAWLPALLLGACAGMDAPGTARHEEVAGARWHWVGMVFDAAATPAPEPARYWIEFASEGGVVVNADCNGGLGRLAGPGLALGPIGLTRRMCDPRSLGVRFARLLSAARGGTFDGGLLRLHTDASDLLFTRSAAARMVRYVCPSGVPRDVVFDADLAYLRVDGRFRPLRRTGSGAAVFAGGDMIISTKDGELTVETRGGGRVGPCAPEA
jgi:heat shock protein HslJ